MRLAPLRAAMGAERAYSQCCSISSMKNMGSGGDGEWAGSTVMARIVERRGGWGNWIQIFSAVVSTGAGFLALALAVAVALLLIFPSFRRPNGACV